MKIFITGGAGYIGSHVALKCLKERHEVCIFDSLERGHFEAVKRIQEISQSNCIFIQGDIRVKQDIENAISDFKPDVLVHFAGYKSVGEGENKKEEYRINNIEGSNNVIDSCVKNNVKRIVFSSSAGVYGNYKYLPINEDHPKEPINYYGFTKLETEKELEKVSKENNIECVVLRYFNAVGADESGRIGEDPSVTTNLVPLIMSTLVGNRESVTLFGDKFNTKDGTQERDYVHVTDLADVHLLVSKCTLDDKFNVYNISTGNPTSCKEIIKLSEQISGLKLNYNVGEARAIDPEILYANGEKIKRELGWSPKLTIKDSIRDQWNWVINNKKGYDK